MKRVHAAANCSLTSCVEILSLDVARRNAVHALARGFFLKFLRSLRCSGQRLAVVEFSFWSQREVAFFGISRRVSRPTLRPWQSCEARCVCRVTLGVVILLVDLDSSDSFVMYAMSISSRCGHAGLPMNSLFWSFAVSGSFVMADDDFVDIGLREFLGLILCSWLAPSRS